MWLQMSGNNCWLVILVICGVTVSYGDSVTMFGSGDVSTIQPTTKESITETSTVSSNTTNEGISTTADRKVSTALTPSVATHEDATVTSPIDVSMTTRPGKTVPETLHQATTLVDTSATSINQTGTTETKQHWSTAPQNQPIQTEFLIAIILPIGLILVSLFLVGLRCCQIRRQAPHSRFMIGNHEFIKTFDNLYKFDHTFGSVKVKRVQSRAAADNISIISQTRNSVTIPDAKSSDSDPKKEPDTTNASMNQNDVPTTSTQNANKIVNNLDADANNKTSESSNQEIPKQKPSPQTNLTTFKPNTLTTITTEDRHTSIVTTF